MATVTSSSTRSKRKSNKPVTTSKGRANRSSVSQAKVSKSGGGTPGSAKVTTGKGGTGTTPKLLPPGKKGGALARSSGGKLAGAAKAAGGAAKVAGAAGRFAGAAGTALAIPAAIKNIADVAERNKRWNEYKERMGMNQKPNSTNRTGQGSTAGRASKPSAEAKPHTRSGQGSGAGRTTPAAKPEAKPDWRSKVGNADPEKLSKPQNKTTNKPQPSAPPKPSGSSSNRPATPSKPSPQGSSSTAKTSSSRNVGPVANGNEYARNKDPKKYNPLMQKTFDYQKGDAPDQRAKKAASEKPDVGYKTSTKVDKNYADKKPSNNTSSAYDKGVNLNPAKPSAPNEKKKKSASQNLAEAIRKRRTNT